jgi:hypothetical protein
MIAPILAAAVYAGCAQPPTTYTATFSATPATIREVLKAAKPGSEILLASGSYGALQLQGWFGDRTPWTLKAHNNAEFITVAAAPHATPVFSQIVLNGGAKWVFRGLTIESVNQTGKWLYGGGPNTDYRLVTIRGPHSDIIFDHNTLQSQSGPFATMTDWVQKRASGIFEYSDNTAASCVAITNNTLRYVGNGVQVQASSKILIAGNTIDYFADDGIDYGSSDLLITGNKITNSVEDGDGIHRDAMQGQPHNATSTNSNVTISDNTIVRDADPANPWPGYLQGIDAFDGVWKNVTVANNTLSLMAKHAISFYGVTGYTASGNTLTLDAGRVMPCWQPPIASAQCQALAPIVDRSQILFITDSPGKLGAPSADVTFTDNVAPGVAVNKTSVGRITVQGNVCHLSRGKCYFDFPINGVRKQLYGIGTLSGGNVIKP